jgi:hypothetical protein
MPRRRKVSVDPELLKEIEELDRRILETTRRNAEILAMADRVQRRLREVYLGPAHAFDPR